MNREETHALYAQGKDAWNKWANEMLAQKKALQDAGEWRCKETVLGPLEPENPATEAWFKVAEAEFSTYREPHKFKIGDEFTGFVFPGTASFEKAMFDGTAWFDGATFGGNARFAEATFAGSAWFNAASFEGVAQFDGATFGGETVFHLVEFAGQVEFKRVTFAGEAGFNLAKFGGEASFKQAKFGDWADFEGVEFEDTVLFELAEFTSFAAFTQARFEGEAQFESATFARYVGFEEAVFEGKAAFVGVTFAGYTAFRKASFQQSAYFTAILSKHAFTLEDAKFGKVPGFSQAHFLEAPRLDNFTILPKCIKGDRVLNVGDPNVTARWRALKRLAIQGHDLEREQQFFSTEIKAARFVLDWPLRLACIDWSPPENDAEKARPWYAYIPFKLNQASVWKGFPRFVFGYLYQFFSDFGRSVWRPTLAFLVLVLLSASAYLGESQIAGGNKPSLFAQRLAGTAIELLPFNSNFRPTYKCTTVSGQNLRPLEPELSARTDALSEAMHLSWTNGSIVGGLGGLDSTRRTYGCLYGFVEDGGKNATPILPARVSAIATTQKLLSVILIFLFGLAIRNMLKMH